MYAPISVSLLALASLFATTCAAPVPEAQTGSPQSEGAYLNISGDSSPTESTDTPSDPISTGGNVPTGANPPMFETSIVPSPTQPDVFPTLPTGMVPSGVVSAGIASGVFPTEFPAAFPTGVFPASVYPPGGFPTGGALTGGFPAGAFPTLINASTVPNLGPTGGSPTGGSPASATSALIDASTVPSLMPTEAPTA